MKQFKTFLLLAFIIGIFLSGCKKEIPKENKRLTIAVIPKGTIHEFWKSVHAGADMAGQELGVDILWKGALKEGIRDLLDSNKRVAAKAWGLLYHYARTGQIS